MSSDQGSLILYIDKIIDGVNLDPNQKIILKQVINNLLSDLKVDDFEKIKEHTAEFLNDISKKESLNVFR